MEIDGNASIQIDTEDAKTEYLDVNGNRALYVEKEGWRKIYIFENDCFTKIRSNGLSKRKLLKVAKSLTDLELTFALQRGESVVFFLVRARELCSGENKHGDFSEFCRKL